jgi:thiopeptide-type bacteriocin biosynthesis protein
MNDFVIRTPIFSLQELNKFYESRNSESFIFNFFLQNALFRESIYLYSIPLYNQAILIANEDSSLSSAKKKSSIADSLIKYFLRMCYRATPFGVAAGVSHARFKRDEHSKKIQYFKRSVKIDSGVFANIINKINSLKSVRWNVKFYTNNTLFCYHDFYRFLERKLADNSFDFVLGKVDKTEFLEEVLELAKGGISAKDIQELLKNEELENEEIEEFIDELIDSNLVISEVQYDVLDVNIERKILNRLRSINSSVSDPLLHKTIQILERTLNLVNELSILPMNSGSSINIITQIDSLLTEFNDSGKSSVKVDLIENSEYSLPFQVKERIQNKIAVITKLSNQFRKGNNDLTNFKKAFVSAYANRTVPILEVLDSQLGIGYPPKLAMDSESKLLKEVNINAKDNGQVGFSNWDFFLLNKYEEFLKQKTSTIRLKEKDIDILDNSETEINDSVMFTGQIYKTENHDFQIYCNSLKIGAAHFVMNRFSYGSDNIKKLCQEIADFEKENLATNQVYSDILHLSQPRLGNVTLRPNYYDHYIPVTDLTNNSDDIEIPLDDLYVFIREDVIGLYSKKLDKQVLPRIGCAQNTQLFTNPVYKFFGAISDDYFLNSWDWGFLNGRKHLPRVEIDNFILAKETWRLNYKEIFPDNIPKKITLKKYIAETNLARYVTMSVGGDNILPLDLSNEKCIGLLLKELYGSHLVTLEEALHSSQNRTMAVNSYGETTNEICVPLLVKTKNRSKTENIKFDLVEINSKIVNGKKRSSAHLFPLQDVLYIKLYIKPGSKVDKIVANKLLIIFSQFRSKDPKGQAFFIRYIDPDYHLRLRFFSDRQNYAGIYEMVTTIFKDEIDSLLISKIQLDTYERELERYGGLEGTKVSEKIFSQDSICVLQVLSWAEHNSRTDELWLFALIGVHFLLNDFKVDEEARVLVLTEMRDFYLANILDPKETKKDISNFYRKNQKVMLDGLTLNNSKNGFHQFYLDRSRKNSTLIEELNQKNIKYDVRNYIHMFLNRLFDYNQNFREAVIYDLLLQSYKSLKYKNVS